ncbi:hypothetical protein AMS68_004042 [Peltaster fructicola]|uniref:Uncharacterized protein n=1 Tax=Peltaster fructicola TaxID=286661 RepID=A0A6H0XV42_9PEZI|nr:hypothetical protein AMS68_004042 [Peltaster fructicola]
MPVVWSADKEAQLIAGIFSVCDVKVTAKHCEQLAAIIGSGCTAKAITHRISKFRTQAAAFNGGSKDKSDGSAPKKKATPKSASKSDKKRSKFVDEDDDDYGTLDLDETPSKKAKKEEPRTSDDDDGFVFKVDGD